MKPQSLRTAIEGAFPELARDRERLNMWIDKGSVKSRDTESRGFEWAYTLCITVENFTEHPSVLFLIINDWLRTNEVELLKPTAKGGFRFEADIIDDKSVDLQVELDLTERVAVTPRADGSAELEHVAEPQTYFPDDDLPLVPPGDDLKALFMDGRQILPGPLA